MKKIFYSLMAVALCSCAQSDVEDVVTPPQPENKGVRFEVVDNGFTYDDGTRVSYGQYGSDAAYKATFENDDQIGIYGITSMNENGTPAAYAFENKPLTLKNGNWTSSESLDLTGVTVLFAYAPYLSNEDLKAANDGEALTFVKNEDGSWELNKGNNRFFVGGNTYNETNNGTKDDFEAADWMGAAVNLSGSEKTITFKMQHMRGMVELTTPKEVELTDLTLAIGKDDGAQYHFKPYFLNETDANRTQNVYRILTTEYRSKNTVYATIKDGAIETKYKKTPSSDDAVGAGKCVQVNIAYTLAPVYDSQSGKTLEEYLTENFTEQYATNANLTKLRLKGTLTGANATDGDWATLRKLTTLKKLDMSELTNTSIPDKWIWRDEGATKTKLCETLTTLVLPNNLESIGNNSLQPNAQLTKLELPASVKTLANGALWCNSFMSVHIPAESQLETIGNGALQYVRVYTDPENVNLFKMPTSVKSIAANAFRNVPSKIVFQTDTPPAEMAVGAFEGTIYVPNKTNYVGKLVGPTITNEDKTTTKINNTIIAGPLLTVENYKAVDKDGKSFTSSSEGTINALCDGPTDKYWHSDYGAAHNYDKWGIYIDIALPKTYNNLTLSYTTRNSTMQLPIDVIIGVATDSGAFTEVGTYNDKPAAAETKTHQISSAGSSFNKVRFGVTNSSIGNTQTISEKKVWTALAELTVYEDMWTE